MESASYVELVIRAREGDLAAFESLVERFQDMAVGYAWGQLGELADAMDAAQEAFIDVLRKIEMLRDPAAFPAWLQTILATHCARQRRGAGAPTADAAVGEPTAEEQVVDRERAARVRRAVGQLPPHERVVIAMHYLGGCTYVQIASLLGISDAAVKKRAHAARTHLREDWEATAMDIEDVMEPHRPSRHERFSSSTLLFAAIARSDIEHARRLLEADPGLVDTTEDWDDDTARQAGLLPARHAPPLVRAVGRGRRDLVELLLRHGAQVNRTCGCEGGESPLWAATVQADEHLVTLLLAHGADPEAAAFEGTTPLHVAAMRGYEPIVQRLIAAGADPEARDAQGSTPADLAGTAKARAAAGSAATTVAAGGHSRPAGGLLESGIKAINLFCPLRAGSLVRWDGPPGTGSLVALVELMHQLAMLEGFDVDVIGFEHAGLTGAELRHALAELDPATRITVDLADESQPVSERHRRFTDTALGAAVPGGSLHPTMVVIAAHPAHLADIEAELPGLLDRAALVVLIDFTGTTTESMPLPADTTVIAFDDSLAWARRFPAIDPQRSTGRYRDDDHAATAQTARTLLARYWSLDPELTLNPRPDEQSWAHTARTLHRALTQPFHTTEPFTGQPGVAVSIDDTLTTVRTILADGQQVEASTDR